MNVILECWNFGPQSSTRKLGKYVLKTNENMHDEVRLTNAN